LSDQLTALAQFRETESGEALEKRTEVPGKTVDIVTARDTGKDGKAMMNPRGGEQR